MTDSGDSALERQRFFDAFNAGYEQLRSEPEEWALILEEREADENVLMDRSA